MVGGSGSTDTGDTSLYFFPGTYYNAFIFPVVHSCIIDIHFNACNAIYQHNKMHQYGLVLEKYWEEA